MKVVLAACGTNHYCGLPKYFYFLAKHLMLNGIEVEFILDSRSKNLIEVLEGEDISRLSVKVIGPICQERFSIPATAIWCWRVSQYLKDRDFDILHCGHVTPYFYLRQRNRKPVVFQPFGNELITFGEIYGGARRLFYKTSQGILEYCGRNADVLLAEDKWQLDEMERFYGRKDTKVLPVGIDIDFIREKASKSGILQDWRGLYGKGKFLLLTVNTFHAHKDYPNLIRALATLPKNIVSIMVGSGPEKDSCIRLASRLGVEDRIKFLEGISEDDLYGLYKIADCYVSPTRVTDFQMGIAEAEAMGLPIVSTSQGFMIDGNGFVVGMGNPGDLAFGIETVYNMTSMREYWGEKSREIVKKWDFKDIAKEAIEIYAELAG